MNDEGGIKNLRNNEELLILAIEQNKNIPYLQREEGGIGSDNNLINKQIRFFILEVKKVHWCALHVSIIFKIYKL